WTVLLCSGKPGSASWLGGTGTTEAGGTKEARSGPFASERGVATTAGPDSSTRSLTGVSSSRVRVGATASADAALALLSLEDELSASKEIPASVGRGWKRQVASKAQSAINNNAVSTSRPGRAGKPTSGNRLDRRAMPNRFDNRETKPARSEVSSSGQAKSISSRL